MNGVAGARAETRLMGERRVALIYGASDELLAASAQAICDYTTFLEKCDFRVKQENIQTGEQLNEDSVTSPSAVLQMIVIVIAPTDEETQCEMKHFLDFMNHNSFSGCNDRFLLFCRVCSGPSAKDEELVKEFSSTEFQYKNCIIAYKDCPNIQDASGFLHGVIEKKKSSWDSVGIYEILKEFHPLYRAGADCPPFLRDILVRDEGDESMELEQPLQSGTQHADWKAKNAPLIYPNRREPKKPLALVVLHFPLESPVPCQVDCRNLMRLLNRLGYKVIDKQTRTEERLKGVIERFANDENHGDSCVVAVLSNAESVLEPSILCEMYKHLAQGKQLLGKPRLFILHEVKNELQTDSAGDTVQRDTSELLLDAIGSMQGYFDLTSSTIKVHPHSGMLFGHATASSTEIGPAGSPFVRTLCEIFEKHASSEDVVSMINLINEHERLRSAPTWTIQTAKLFYVTDTSGIEASNQEVSMPNKSSSYEKCNENPMISRTGFALMLTEGSFDEARNYQMFLEFASFKVHYDHTPGDLESIKAVIGSAKQQCEQNLAVLILVRKHRDNRDLSQIINKVRETRTDQSKSMLLIYCEIFDQAVEGDPLQIDKLNLPEKFCLSSICGTREGVGKYLDSLLDDPRKAANLNGSLVVGCDFCRSSEIEDCIIRFKQNDESPGWKRGVTWLGSYCINDSQASSIRVSDDVDENQPTIRRDKFSLKDSRKEWKGNLPSQDLSSDLPGAARALIVHNVVFEGNKLSSRYGSQHDCQRLTDCLMRLGYSVSIRSNLSKKEIEKEVGLFSKNSGDSAVLAFMSHGNLGETYGSDGKPVKEKKVLNAIAGAPDAGKKQQFIIFQSCRNQHSGSGGTRPFHPGCIIAHSTSPADLSVRVKTKGSRFMQSLCSVMELFATKEDIVSLIPLVNFVTINTVYDGFSQLPWWSAQTSRRHWLASEQSRAANVASSLQSLSLRSLSQESERSKTDYAQIIYLLLRNM